jgi:two-component system cell cycle response regulator
MPARVLIIEDNAANLELMAYLLRAFGYLPITATDGMTGLEAAKQDPPDIIVCDIQLPGLDGYEIARSLKADPNLKDVPLIAVTALAMVGDRDRVLAEGFDGYIGKPIAPETFVGEIEMFLSPSLRSGYSHKASPSEPVVIKPVDTESPTILVVDNQRLNLELAQSVLEPSGYRVIVAHTVGEALRALREANPDLVLSDIKLNGESGFDLIVQMKADARLAAIPFVFITATYAGPNYKRRAMDLGASKFLVRPLEPAVLLREIESCVRDFKNEAGDNQTDKAN